MASQNLFRKQALEHATSPDNLERLMPVTGAKDWLIIVVLGALLGLLGVWSVSAHVPTIAAGRGVILRPRQVVETQSAAAGRILSIRVRSGDRLHVGDLIATVDQDEILKRIEEDRRTLAALEQEDGNESSAGHDQISAQSQQDRTERASLEAQRVNLRKDLEGASALKPVLETHAKATHQLVNEGLMAFASREVSDAESAVRDNDAKIYDYNSRLSLIDGQLNEIETRSVSLARQILDEAAARRNQIEQLRRNIEINEFELRRNGNIFSQYSGLVAEVLAAPGQVLAVGGRLLTLEADGAETPLISISYFPVRDGKKIQPGMPIQITPDTVERERFGGIVGSVISVSPIPVTKDGAKSVVGNSELVESLMREGAYIEVRARLETDTATFSGYRWSSSRGPRIQITSGLTHSTRVMIERRAPVTYLLPVFREATGFY